ncbi:MAG: hypothetical protein RL318_1182 [Fibrobacterota bacterium]
MQLQDPDAPVDSGLNLGPQSRRILSRIGIRTLGELQRAGSVEAYLLCKELDEPVSLNLLWALEGALTGKPWQSIARERRQDLLTAMKAALAGR